MIMTSPPAAAPGLQLANINVEADDATIASSANYPLAMSGGITVGPGYSGASVSLAVVISASRAVPSPLMAAAA